MVHLDDANIRIVRDQQRFGVGTNYAQYAGTNCNLTRHFCNPPIGCIFASMSLHLILLRGLPGCGKTTLADVLGLLPDAVVCSIDDYFTDTEGNYEFVFHENHLAYKQCIDRVQAAMMTARAHIIVHNTFVYDWEMLPYLDLAKEFGYQLHVTTVEKYHSSSNVHEVSEEQIEKMATKFQVKLH
jgi:predicted kinase